MRGYSRVQQYRCVVMASLSTLALCAASEGRSQSVSPTAGQSPSAATGAPGAAEVNQTAPTETAPASPARTAPRAAERGIQDIIVTAQKREENLSRVPMSVSAFSANQVADRQITSPQDLVKLVPSFNFVQSLTGTPVYSIRGVGFNDTSSAARPTVSVYVDQAPLPFSVETVGATLDLERLEVLKGPQGTLFGQNSTGGAINYIAAKPTSTWKAGGTATYGNYNYNNVEGFVSGPLTDTLSFRIAAKHEGRDPWQQSQTRDEKLGSRDVSVGRVLLKWVPTDKLHVNLNLNGFIDHSDQQAAQYISFHATTPSQTAKIPLVYRTMPSAPEDNRIADWTPGRDYRHHDKFGQASMRIDYDLSKSISVTSISSFNQFKGNYYQDVDGSAYLFFEGGLKSNLKTFSQELRASANLDNGLRLIVGGNYENSKIHQEFDEHLNATPSFGFSALPGGPAQFTNVKPKFDYTTDVYAAFANADWELGDRFTLHGGVRYTRDKTNFAGCNYDGGDGAAAQGFTITQNRIQRAAGAPLTTIQPGGCITFNTTTLRPDIVRSVLDENSISWRGGIDYKPSSATMIYANVTKGYKIGSFPLLGASFDTQYKAAGQESVQSYEAGVKTNILDRTLRLEAAGFYYDYRNKQVFGSFQDPTFGALKAEVNIPKSWLYGFEGSATWAPSASFTLSASGTYLKSKIKNFTVLTIFNENKNIEGEDFPFTPKFSGTIDAEWRVPVGDNKKFFLGMSARGQTKSNAELGNYDEFKISPYALYDLRVGMRGGQDRWKVSVWVNNVTNKYYWTNSSTYEDTIVRYTGMPRTFGVTLTFKTE